MKKIIIYHENAVQMNGMIIWTLNFIKKFKLQYDIKVYARNTKQGFDVVFRKHEPDIRYSCDILIAHFEGDYDVPENIRYEKEFVVLHCDYGHKVGPYNMNPKLYFPPEKNYIAVSERVAEGMKETFDISCTVINPLLGEKPEKERVYKFVSPVRPVETKGIEIIECLAHMLTMQNVHFQWMICYDPDWLTSHFDCDIPGVIPMEDVPHSLLLQYMADADYVVVPSKKEGFCLAVHEALMMGTPVIASDIPVFRNIVVNGYNGYRISFSPTTEGIMDILHNIPKNFRYTPNDEENAHKWIEMFENE